MKQNEMPRYTITHYSINCPKCGDSFKFRSTDIELTLPVKAYDKTFIYQYVKCPLCENKIFFDIKGNDNFKLTATINKQYAEKHRL